MSVLNERGKRLSGVPVIRFYDAAELLLALDCAMRLRLANNTLGSLGSEVCNPDALHGVALDPYLRGCMRRVGELLRL